MWRVHVCTGIADCAVAQLFIFMLQVSGVSFACHGLMMLVLARGMRLQFSAVFPVHKRSYSAHFILP
jgi:hypothetical protein